MKKIIIGAFIGFIVLSVAKCSHTVYSGFTNTPEYATEELLSQKYLSLIADVDEQIVNSTSALSLAANLETLDYPGNVVFVNLEKDEGEDIVVKSMTIDGSHSTFVKIGFGYGKIGSQDIVVITRSVNKHDLEDVEIFLEYRE